MISFRYTSLLLCWFWFGYINLFKSKNNKTKIFVHIEDRSRYTDWQWVRRPKNRSSTHISSLLQKRSDWKWDPTCTLHESKLGLFSLALRRRYLNLRSYPYTVSKLRKFSNTRPLHTIIKHVIINYAVSRRTEYRSLSYEPKNKITANVNRTAVS